jgi:hypothetical protein
MALDYIFIDGFDHYAAAAVTSKYTSGSISSMLTGASPITRFSYGQAAAQASALRKDFATTYRYWIVGRAFKLTTSLNNSGIIAIQDVSAVHAEVFTATDGSIKVTVPGGTVTSIPGLVNIGDWHHCILALDIANSGGKVYVYLDGVLVASNTSIDTQSGSNQYAATVVQGRSGSEISATDDFYVMAGSSTTDLEAEVPGDLWVSTYLPNGVGDVDDWVPLSGNNYTNVDEVPADDDTSYNTGSTAEDTDLFQIEDLHVDVGTILSVQNSFTGAFAPATAGPQQIRTIYKSGGVEHEGATLHALSSDYRIYSDNHPLNESTGLPWTRAGFDAHQSGYRKKT